MPVREEREGPEKYRLSWRYMGLLAFLLLLLGGIPILLASGPGLQIGPTCVVLVYGRDEEPEQGRWWTMRAETYAVSENPVRDPRGVNYRVDGLIHDHHLAIRGRWDIEAAWFRGHRL